jgi:hypothetical protein
LAQDSDGVVLVQNARVGKFDVCEFAIGNVERNAEDACARGMVLLGSVRAKYEELSNATEGRTG